MIPIVTTMISVFEPRDGAADPSAEGYNGSTPGTSGSDLVLVASGQLASITLPNGRDGTRSIQGTDSEFYYTLRTDYKGLTNYQVVLDEDTGDYFEVAWATLSRPTGFGLDHTKAKLRQTGNFPTVDAYFRSLRA